MAFLSLESVSKSFGEGTRRTEVLADIHLAIEEGEFIAIVGFSGSGKSTLINLIAGLLTPDTGSIAIGGQTIRGAGPDRGVIFQNYSLLPWLSVYENVALAVDQVFTDWPASRRRAHTLEYIEMVNLTPALNKKPHELSGGMRQRVAVARALAMDPHVLLMDEPLGALDALTRATLQEEIERIWRLKRKTAVMITNDVDEAMLLADRIFPLHPGPRATLGPSFSVELARPRQSTELNSNDHFKSTRNELIKYLSACRHKARLLEAERARSDGNDDGDTQIVLPDVQPLDAWPAGAS